MAKKSVFFGEYIITQEDGNEIRVAQIFKKALPILKKICDEHGLSYPEHANTQRLGAIIAQKLGDGNRAEIDGYTIERRGLGSNRPVDVMREYPKGTVTEVLRQIAASVGIGVNPKWNTHTLGSKLIDLIENSKSGSASATEVKKAEKKTETVSEGSLDKSKNTVKVELIGNGYQHDILLISDKEEKERLRKYCAENDANAIKTEFIEPVLNFDIEPTHTVLTFDSCDNFVNGNKLDYYGDSGVDLVKYARDSNRYLPVLPQGVDLNNQIPFKLLAELVDKVNKKSEENEDYDPFDDPRGYLFNLYSSKENEDDIWLVVTQKLNYIRAEFYIEIPEGDEFDESKLKICFEDYHERKFNGQERIGYQFVAYYLVYDGKLYEAADLNYTPSGSFAWVIDAEQAKDFELAYYDALWTDA